MKRYIKCDSLPFKYTIQMTPKTDTYFEYGTFYLTNQRTKVKKIWIVEQQLFDYPLFDSPASALKSFKLLLKRADYYEGIGYYDSDLSIVKIKGGSVEDIVSKIQVEPYKDKNNITAFKVRGE
ncbi:MAG: hypothetical protein LUC17_01260 [Oscillospiraceae bacterium]|nr:hypothetical protein [Oscillospiraceae bacterium]